MNEITDTSAGRLLDQDLLQRRQSVLGNAVMASLVETFGQVHAETVERIIATARAHDYEDVRSYAHALKGAAATLGMDALTVSADLIEHAALTRDVGQLEPKVRDLPELFQASLMALRTVAG